MSTAEISLLKTKRATLKGKLTRLSNYLDEISKNILTGIVIKSLHERYLKFQSILDEYDEIQIQIDILEPDNVDENDTYRSDFEYKYYEIVGKLNHLLDTYNESNLDEQFLIKDNVHSQKSSEVGSQNGSVQITNNQPVSINLPPIKLPTFDGNYCNWLEFKDAFVGLVDSNQSLSNYQKFYYLRASLGKEVLQTIKSLKVTSENYRTAWQKIIERYESKNLLIHNHIKAIFECTSISRESHDSLRNLSERVANNLLSLKALGEDTDKWDSLIIYVLCTKFDNVTKREWESYKCFGNRPTMSDMYTFLREKCEILEKIEFDKDHNKFKSNTAKRHFPTGTFTTTNGVFCYYCQKNHFILNCNEFLSFDVPKRIASVKRLKLCLNCLKGNHPFWKCRSKKCSKCKKSHHDLLHLDQPFNGNENVLPNTNEANYSTLSCSNEISITSDTHLTSALGHTRNSQVLLSTAIVKVKHNDTFHYCRALLDSGSQSNFISQRIVEKIGLKTTKINHSIKGVGQILSNISKKVRINIMSCYDNFCIDIDCLVLPNITDKLPVVTFDRKILNLPSQLQLADPKFNVSQDIDILLGSSLFWSLLCFGQERLGNNLPILQNTRLGWIISGNLLLPYERKVVHNPAQSLVYCNNDNFNDLLMNDTVMKFWQLEDSCYQNPVLSDSEVYCEKYFNETTTRDENGRFVVRIPFKNSLHKLGNSYDIALKRFLSLEKKLTKNDLLKKDYCNFMNEYQDLGHMSKGKSDITEGYFMPHHAVIKNTSLTTKCRVVFDASCKTSTNISLNELQFVGATLQQDIFSILVRFRKHNFVMTADISKMYRQILVNIDDRKYQKIIWRSDPLKPLEYFDLNTVTYGTASAPFLAVRCLIQLSKDNESDYPNASKIIRDDFYMDDLLTGAQTEAELQTLQREIFHILASGGFHLRKWLSNSSELLKHIVVKDDLETNILEIGENMATKTLGIFWDAHKDIIKYSCQRFDNFKNITKRSVLAIICQIFDPLGFLGPVIITAKLFIQELWRLRLSWDDEVPQNIATQWIAYLSELSDINNIEIPRQAAISLYFLMELHGFCDASMNAYGAVLYIRCKHPSGSYISNLLCAKSKIAPLKQVSLPRLELCASVLLANLANKTLKALEISFDQRFFWTDSQITLAWIRGDSSRWKVFVANRVSEIQQLTNINEWHHVSSSQNPADILSRGCTATSLINKNIWWNGPEFLSYEKSTWNLKEIAFESDIPEQRTYNHMNVNQVHNNVLDELILKFSSVTKLFRVLAYVQRFMKNIKEKAQLTGNLNLHEIESSKSLLLRYVQNLEFPIEYNCLIKNKALPKKSKILSLNPFLEDGLIRVGGRLRNANQHFNKRFPVILPKSHVFTELLIKCEHIRLMHCGVQMLLNSIREYYWPISGRNMCKKIVRNCVICFKNKPIFCDYLMGDLPNVRVNAYSPFINVGVDYAGPVLLKDRKTRGAKLIKSYICLFVCLSIKAIHIELVTELTTEGFLGVLRRFISRRGKPSNIYSDNGLNFVGANNEINELYSFLKTNSENITNDLITDKIQWHFIPARSPHFGGIWEAGIKSTKFHLKRTIGKNLFTFEEFYSILVQIEGILNSRPLSPLTSDPEDLNPLTPAHFLIGRSLTAMPEEDFTNIPEGRLKRFQLLQSVIQHYWTRWSKEYLAELQTRSKWKQKGHMLLKIGSLVIIKTENSSPMNWPIGRIVELYPGKDGVTRVVDIKTASGQIRRAITNVCALPIEENLASVNM